MKSDREELELLRTIRVVLENGDRLAKDAEYLWEMDRFPSGAVERELEKTRHLGQLLARYDDSLQPFCGV